MKGCLSLLQLPFTFRESFSSYAAFNCSVLPLKIFSELVLLLVPCGAQGQLRAKEPDKDLLLSEFQLTSTAEQEPLHNVKVIPSGSSQSLLKVQFPQLSFIRTNSHLLPREYTVSEYVATSLLPSK